MSIINIAVVDFRGTNLPDCASEFSNRGMIKRTHGIRLISGFSAIEIGSAKDRFVILSKYLGIGGKLHIIPIEYTFLRLLDNFNVNLL